MNTTPFPPPSAPLATIDAFDGAVAGVLPAGEFVTAWTNVFDPVWRTYNSDKGPQTVCRGLCQYRFVVTNLSVRIIVFQTESRKEGLLKRVSYPVPRVANEISIPLTNITMTGLQRYPDVNSKVRQAVCDAYGHAYWRGKIPVWELHVHHAGGSFVSTATHEGLEQIHRTVEDLRAGQLLAANQSTAGEALQRLAELRANGVIDEAEFAAAKRAFLGAAPDEAQKTLSSMRQLHEMAQAGALTEGVLRMALTDLLVKLGG